MESLAQFRSVLYLDEIVGGQACAFMDQVDNEQDNMTGSKCDIHLFFNNLLHCGGL